MNLLQLGKISAFGLFLGLGLVACEQSGATLADTHKQADAAANRGKKKIKMDGLAKTSKFKLDKSKKMENIQTITLTQQERAAAAAEDAQAVVSIFNSLLTAQNTAKTLNLNLSMSEEPIEDGVFVFAVESPVKQDLAFELYDEEGFGVAAQNTLKLDAGANYAAFNLRDLSNGEYLMSIKDSEGAMMMRRVVIQDKQIN